MSKNPHIAVLIMCKNENKRFHVTLESIVGYVNSIIVYDTGSTDNTIDIVENFSKINKISLHLKKGTFTNFSESRNISLDFADEFTEIDYILLMDVNDELKNGAKLIEYCKEYISKENTGFLVCQQWLNNSLDKYYNLRLVKARCGWRYRGTVHEWMKNTAFEDGKEPHVVRLPDDMVLYQDRTQDDNKSSIRFLRDKVLLTEEHRLNQTEPRTIFYLAQTCSCLNNYQEAFYYYKLRIQLEGFQEERFHAFLRCGDISINLGNPWHDSLIWFMKAYEHSRRVEPLVKITEYYNTTKQFDIAYVFASLACSLQYPTHSILFVEKHSYDYKRWHLLSVCSWFTKNYDVGKKACIQAILAGINSKLDTDNLICFENQENQEKQEKLEKLEKSSNPNPNPNPTNIINKKSFIANYINKNTNTILSKKQLISNAKKLWKTKERV